MTLEAINNRIELLKTVFAYSLAYRNALSIGQRICISQEHAALLRCREVLIDKNKVITPRYVLPDHLEEKLQKTHQHIKNIGWVKPPFEPFF